MTLRSTFTAELHQLQSEILAMGSMVDKAIGRSVDALKRLDHAEARRIIQDDQEINARRFAIEQQAIQLIATQQPIATDLRCIVAALNIIVDLERMGDHAEGIAKIVLMHNDVPLLKPLVDVPLMAEKTQEMLRRTMDAYMNLDVEAARAIALEDDVVDRLYEQVYRELIHLMVENPSCLDRATWLMWVSHNLERCADRVTNICERIVFQVTGRMEEINTSNY
ncbi:MAG: phosphate signaling complex protein PhoU [Chloroflexota bacterium]